MLLPLSAFFTILFINGKMTPYVRKRYSDLDRRTAAVLELVKYLAGILTTILFALACAKALTLFGLDSRASFPLIGPVLGTYVQRNSLIVGFIMGFAIIPIIYTISDDALTSVPEHLRSASLASGATPWQTTVRVIVPTAMSGLFSATMIGLGRAVGETMIVLMAAGNTPILEWNIFNGFRTLAANIAVELPEAVVGSTHYRILFLAALTLFVITFIVNTVAEVIRQRFRKRAFEL
jgi:phosphate transport system permease protein